MKMKIIIILLILTITQSIYSAKNFKEFFNNFKPLKSITFEATIINKEKLKNLDDKIKNYLSKIETSINYNRTNQEIKISTIKENINKIKNDLSKKHSVYFLEEDLESINLSSELVKNTKNLPNNITTGEDSYDTAKGGRVEYRFFRTKSDTAKDENNLKEFIKTLKLKKGYKIYYKKEGYKKKLYYKTFVLKNDLSISGYLIKDSYVGLDKYINSPTILLIFNNKGKKLFANLTKRIAGHRLAIVIDGIINTIPVVNEEIPGGKIQITFGTSLSSKEQIKKANKLARQLLTSSFTDFIKLKK